MLVSEPGNTAQWQKLVHEAADVAGTRLDEELESYLVFMLMRYLRRGDMVQRILALDFLRALERDQTQRGESLREVGDQCLLFCGLFPSRAEKRRVNVSYYVDLGRSAYSTVAESMVQLAQLYQRLSREFVHVMDTLLAIRQIGGNENGLTLLAASELWQDTHSEMARQTILRHGNGKVLLMRGDKTIN